jgi:DnaJ-domain-containing protein 1
VLLRWLIILALLLFIVSRVRRLLARSRPQRPMRPLRKSDPHAVLGVPRDASPSTITKAYRQQLKNYHPDRVADLGPELQRVAHEKTIEIQRAYDELMRAR